MTLPSKPLPSKSKGIILHVGTDHYAVQQAAAADLAAHAPEDPMNLETIDAQVDLVDGALRSINDLKAAIQTLPFFGGPKLVWWKNVNFLTDDGPGKSERVHEALESLLTVLQQVDGVAVQLLISALGANKVRRFYKGLAKLTEPILHDLPDMSKVSEEELHQRVAREAAEAGLRLSDSVIERLAHAHRFDTRALRSTLEKLSLYAGAAATVTDEEARYLVLGEQEALVWDYCNAVLAAQPKRALDELAALLRQGESEVGILILLSQQVRLAALAACLTEAQLLKPGAFKPTLKPEAEVFLPKKKSGETINLWQLGQVAQRTKHRPARFWVRAVERVFQVNQQLVTGTADKVRALELLTLELAST